MIIGFDAKRIYNNRTGLGNYSRRLIAQIAEVEPSHELLLFTPSVNLYPDFMAGNTRVKKVLPVKSYQAGLSGIWRRKWISKDIINAGVNVFHGLSNELPYGLENKGVKKIVTIHDLIFLREPSLYPWIDRRIYRRKFSHAAEVADLIIATSHQTRQDIVELLGIAPSKVKVIYQDCDPVFGAVPDKTRVETAKSRYALHKPFIFSVGTIEKRKNHLNLIKAFAQSGLTDFELIIAGKKSTAWDEVSRYVSENNLSGSVRFIHDIDYEYLPVFYKLARAFVYISRIEGFGIPVLEAMRSGTVPVTSSVSSMPEVCGNAGLLTDPESVEEISQSLRMAVSDESVRNRIIQAIPTELSRYSSEVVVNQLMNAYRQ